ncbi:hypothetical protein AK830_g4842 [Neonectria ditissima]|uniref:Zn(2)-C6 fungal-type domain-containing protein n=1 Tax=Neonectria ditissima TaxID=78410 RepID=A0A0P7BM41_9HYPO|nr:hypothetical protein AK830_g4842 [Neonectria ditissima]
MASSLTNLNQQTSLSVATRQSTTTSSDQGETPGFPMPICRKKACAQCREAKARCSLALPRCSRCIQRRLDCDYSGHAARASPYPGASTGAALSGSTGFAPDMPTQVESSFLHTPEWSSEVGYDQNHPITMPLAENPLHASTWPFEFAIPRDETSSGCLLAPTPPLEPINPILGFPSGFNITSGSNCASASNNDNAITNFPSDPSTETNFLAPRGSSKPLTKRRPLTSHGFFAAKIILGHVESYPKMMFQGDTLPPFIHSKCSLHDGLTQTCVKDQGHKCLSPTLSICVSLVQLFYSKTPENSAFVWKTIYSELARLSQEHESYDDEALLEALQAICIYTILQSLDSDSIEVNDTKLLLAALGTMGSILHDRSSYTSDYCALNGRRIRHEWMIHESSRRTICLMFIIETLLDVIIGERDSVECNGFGATPLPCIRDLWETKSTTKWVEDYRNAVLRRRRSKPLTVRDLKLSVTSPNLSSVSSGENDAVRSEIMSWCESLDPFGTIVWMAATLAKAT